MTGIVLVMTAMGGCLVAGLAVGVALCRAGAVPGIAATGGGQSPVGAQQQLVHGDLSAVAAQLAPAWSSNVESARQQMEVAVGALTERFAGIVLTLEQALAVSGAVGQDGRSDVFESARQRLGQVVSTLDVAVAKKKRTLDELGVLVELNEHMKSMTRDVTRIAAQTHLLALNAAIEAERVGEAGRAFGVVAKEVRQLADMSGTTGERIGQMAEQVSSAITNTLALAHESAQEEGVMVHEANASVQQVLEDLMGFVGRMHENQQELGAASSQIKDEISESIIQFQFQDRVGQVLMHVRDSIDHFTQELGERGDSAAYRGLDVDGMLGRLTASYTMVEEFSAHGSGDRQLAAVSAASDDITFF